MFGLTLPKVRRSYYHVVTLRSLLSCCIILGTNANVGILFVFQVRLRIIHGDFVEVILMSCDNIIRLKPLITFPYPRRVHCAINHRRQIWRILSMDNYQRFFFVNLCGLLVAVPTPEFLLQKVEVENDTVKNYFGCIWEDQPKVKDAISLVFVIQVYNVFNRYVVQHSHA